MNDFQLVNIANQLARIANELEKLNERIKYETN